MFKTNTNISRLLFRKTVSVHTMSTRSQTGNFYIQSVSTNVRKRFATHAAGVVNWNKLDVKYKLLLVLLCLKNVLSKKSLIPICDV
jgi:predicted GIY-YIG superfamily endonuclease